MNNEKTPFLIAEDIRKSFRLGRTDIQILKGVSFTVEQGSRVALLGASGSGKTTLLDILGSLSRPDSGKAVIAGQDITHLSRHAQVKFRRKNIGFVFQSYHILPELNVLENVMLPARLDGMNLSEVRTRAEELLEKVGLSHRMKHRPNELSGGEQQRTAIARAMMNKPPLILADEPTGNLDSVTGQGILELFTQLQEETKATVLMVTHDRHVASLSDRIIELRDGLICNPEQEGSAL